MRMSLEDFRMSNVQDVMKKMRVTQSLIALAGCTAAFNIEFHRRIQEIGVAICEEAGVERGSDAAMHISGEGELGPKAQKAFDEFTSWFDQSSAPQQSTDQ